jgi:hypothetical protein
MTSHMNLEPEGTMRPTRRSRPRGRADRFLKQIPTAAHNRIGAADLWLTVAVRPE